MKKNSTQKGFTLVEMMVAVSIFIIVAFIVTTTLLTLSSAYKRSQKLRLALDNLNFTLQDISINLREGKDLNCSGTSCSFRPASNWLFNSGEAIVKSCYSAGNRTTDGSPSIFYCESCFASTCDSSSGTDLLSPEIQLKSLRFTELPASNQRYKLIDLFINVLAVKTAKETVEIPIQATIAQRNQN